MSTLTQLLKENDIIEVQTLLKESLQDKLDSRLYQKNILNPVSLKEADDKDIEYWLTTKNVHKVPLDKDKRAIGTVANGTIKKGTNFDKADVEAIKEAILKEGLLRESYESADSLEQDILGVFKTHKNAPKAVIWKDYDLELYMWAFNSKLDVGDVVKMGGEALGKVIKVVKNPFEKSLTEDEIDDTSEDYNDDYDSRSDLVESKLSPSDIADLYASQDSKDLATVKTYIKSASSMDVEDVYMELKKNYINAIAADFKDEYGHYM